MECQRNRHTSINIKFALRGASLFELAVIAPITRGYDRAKTQGNLNLVGLGGGFELAGGGAAQSSGQI